MRNKIFALGLSYSVWYASLSGVMQIDCDNLSLYRNDRVHMCDHAWIEERDEIVVDIYL